MNLPTYLTLARILSIPLLTWVLLTHGIGSESGKKELIASAIFIAAALTDRFDGYLARKRRQVTTLGILLDPLADKLFIASAFIALLQFNPHLVKAWIVVVIIAREVLVSDLRELAATEGFAIQASDLGKMKMAAQVVSAVAVILDHRWTNVVWVFGRFHFVLGIELIAHLALWYMVAVSVISAVDYFVAFWTTIDRTRKYRRAADALANTEQEPVEAESM